MIIAPNPIPRNSIAASAPAPSPQSTPASLEQFEGVQETGTIGLIPSSLRNSPLQRLEGKWVLHTYIGERLFEDELKLQRTEGGDLEGDLSVPGGFTAPVENLKAQNALDFSFEIEPDEGNGAFRVFYQAEFDPKDEVFVGFARHQNGDLIGGFVAQRPKEAKS